MAPKEPYTDACRKAGASAALLRGLKTLGFNFGSLKYLDNGFDRVTVVYIAAARAQTTGALPILDVAKEAEKLAKFSGEGFIFLNPAADASGYDLAIDIRNAVWRGKRVQMIRISRDMVVLQEYLEG